MDEITEAASAELADMLEANDVSAKYIDPRTVPTRFSLLKTMELSAAHYRSACQKPQDDSLASRLAQALPGPDKKAALRFGNATHAMLFDTGTVATFTGPQRRGKVWDAFQAECAERGDVEILNQREMATAKAITDAVRANPTAMRLLFDGTIVEQRIDWELMGKACRSTPDARQVGKHVVDLKTTVSAAPETFRRLALRFHYEAQASFYGDAIEAIGEPRPAEYYIVAVEKTPPYPVTVLRFTAEALELGAKLCRLWFERLLACEHADSWPAYAPPPAIVDLDVDHWGEER